MISPLNTVITNKTGELRRYRFTRFSITLAAKSTAEQLNYFRCNGDIFTMIENNQEAEQLLCDYRLGLIGIQYEIDDTFVAQPKDNIAPISGRAQLTLQRHAEAGGSRNEYEHVKLVIVESGNSKPVKGATIKIDNNKPVTTDENGFIDTYVTKLPSGHYNVTITADGYEKKEITISLPLPPLQVISIDKGREVYFTIKDKQGNNLPNTTIYFQGYGAQGTDENGFVRFKHLPASPSSVEGESSLEFKLEQGEKSSTAPDGDLTYYVYKPGFVPVKGYLSSDEGGIQLTMLTSEERSSYDAKMSEAASKAKVVGESLGEPAASVPDEATETATEPENVAETVSRATKARESDPAYKGMFEASVMEAPKTETKSQVDVVKYEPGQAPKVGKISSVDDLPVQMFGIEGKAKGRFPRSLEEMPTVEFGSDEGMKNAVKGVKDLPVIEVGEKNAPTTTKGRSSRPKKIQVK